MAEDTNLALAKKANSLIADVVKVLKESDASKEDISRFEEINTGFNNACGMINGSERSAAFAAGWMVSMANNAVFLLFRRNIMAKDIEEKYRELPSTEEAMAAFNAILDEDNEEAKKLEEQRRAFMDEQHKLDIFKAVLGGKSKEEAEEKLQQYQQAVAKSLGA